MLGTLLYVAPVYAFPTFGATLRTLEFELSDINDYTPLCRCHSLSELLVMFSEEFQGRHTTNFPKFFTAVAGHLQFVKISGCYTLGLPWIVPSFRLCTELKKLAPSSTPGEVASIICLLPFQLSALIVYEFRKEDIASLISLLDSRCLAQLIILGLSRSYEMERTSSFAEGKDFFSKVQSRSENRLHLLRL